MTKELRIITESPGHFYPMGVLLSKPGLEVISRDVKERRTISRVKDPRQLDIRSMTRRNILLNEDKNVNENVKLVVEDNKEEPLNFSSENKEAIVLIEKDYNEDSIDEDETKYTEGKTDEDESKYKKRRLYR